MATFVLIPGGWRGGWTFADFIARLKREGHEAYAVTLSGLEETADGSAGHINLDTHIGNVIELLEVEDLSEVILCSHSYGGMVATGVADRMAERIAALVYLDAFVPEDGQSWWDIADDRFRRLILERARRDGFSVLPPFGADPRCRPHPIGTFTQALELASPQKDMPRVFVYASAWDATPFTPQYQRLKEDPAWIVHSVASVHDIVNTVPDQVFAILMEVAHELSLAST
jgi:pimeloyl-ACP methyl ester carboxylesterase